MFTVPTETEVKHCATCGMGICPGADATPEQRAEAVQDQSREWVQKDIPQEEWEAWVREFVAAQIRCAGAQAESAMLLYLDRLEKGAWVSPEIAAYLRGRGLIDWQCNLTPDGEAAAKRAQPCAEVEFWIEPLPGSGATIPAFKAQSKEHGLHWLNVTSKQFKGHYQMKPRRVSR